MDCLYLPFFLCASCCCRSRVAKKRKEEEHAKAKKHRERRAKAEAEAKAEAVLAEQPNRSNGLITLRLARCSITDEGLPHLAKLESLEELDLNGCVRVSSAGLGDCLARLARLASLDVSYCPGILRSSWQGKVDALRSLDLECNAIASLEALQPLWALGGLTDLRLRGNMLPLASYRRLLALIPG